MDHVNEEPKDDTELDEVPEDSIDKAMSEVIDELTKSSDDSDLDTATDLLFDVIGDLVDDEKITELPSEDASEEEKAKWLEAHLATVKEELTKAWNDEEHEETADDDGDMA